MTANMKIVKLFYPLLFILMVNISSADDSVFSVLAVNGPVFMQSGEGSEWKNLKAGESLNNDMKVRLDGDAYLGLVHKSGYTMEIKETGIYDVNDLNKNFTGDENKLAKKLSGYVIHEIQEARDVLNSDEYQLFMDGSAGVERDIDGRIVLLGPKMENLILPEGDVPLKYFNWDDTGIETDYDFYIMDGDGEIVYEKQTDKKNVAVNLEAVDLQKGVKYSWNVKPAGEVEFDAASKHFRVLSDQVANEIKNGYSILVKNMEDKSSPLNMLLLAKFYENNKLWSDASKVYQRILMKYPEVEAFRNLYEYFNYRMSGNAVN